MGSEGEYEYEEVLVEEDEPSSLPTPSTTPSKPVNRKAVPKTTMKKVIRKPPVKKAAKVMTSEQREAQRLEKQREDLQTTIFYKLKQEKKRAKERKTIGEEVSAQLQLFKKDFIDELSRLEDEEPTTKASTSGSRATSEKRSERPVPNFQKEKEKGKENKYRGFF